MVRRLHFEAYTFVAADLRHRVERTDDEPVRKMPRVERESRVEAVRERVGALAQSDERVPGASVVDLFNSMAEDGSLKYVPWTKIVSVKIEVIAAKLTVE